MSFASSRLLSASYFMSSSLDKTDASAVTLNPNTNYRISMLGFINGQFVALLLIYNSGYNSLISYSVITSQDGNIWNKVGGNIPMLFPSVSQRGIIYGNNTHIAIQIEASSSGRKLLVSSDNMVSWSQVTGNDTPSDFDFPYENKNFAGNFFYYTFANRISYSSNGINWIKITLPTNQDSYINPPIYLNNKYFIPANYGSINEMFISSDGINWTKISTPFSFYTIKYGNGKFVAIGLNKTAYSSDGINWTQSPQQLPSSYGSILNFLNNKFYIIYRGITFYSSNGESWTQVTNNLYPASSSFFYINGYFVNDDISMTSLDAINWRPIRYYIPNTQNRNDRVLYRSNSSNEIVFLELFASIANYDSFVESYRMTLP